VAGTEIPLPGVNIYTSPDDLSVSDTGLIAFDNGGNVGVVVYDSATGKFVPTGLSTSGNAGPRDPALSGDGKFLATTCITGPGTTCPNPNLNSTHSTLFVQSLVTQTDTGLPFIDPKAGAGGTDEEHPCIDANGGLVGADAVDPNTVNPPPNFQSDVYVFDRSTGSDLTIPGLNTPGKDTIHCVLSFGGAYVGVSDDNGVVRAYDVAAGSQIAVPSTIIPPIWFTAPFVPPNAPTITAPANGAQLTSGQVVDASYSCQDPSGGLGIASCAGPVASGSPVDTNTPGTHSFTVTATDVNGLTAVTTSTYTVLPSPSSTAAGPVVSVGPSVAQVKAALSSVLKPRGKAAKIGRLLRNGGYSFSFAAPSAGRLVIDWYLVANGTHGAKAKKPVLVASASVVFHNAVKATIKVSLTGKGRKLLKNAKRVKLTAKATFTPAGGTPTTTTTTITLKP
jgi:hypothetical protein